MSNFLLPADLKSRLSVRESCLEVLVLLLKHHHLLFQTFEHCLAVLVKIKKVGEFSFMEKVDLLHLVKNIFNDSLNCIEIINRGCFAEAIFDMFMLLG